MDKINLIKEIMDSNLKDETKLELVRMVTDTQSIQFVPYVIRETPTPYWSEIIC